ncbi:MAG: DUF4142 domain-containing protein [Hyphomonadaceae bacterium]
MTRTALTAALLLAALAGGCGEQSQERPVAAAPAPAPRAETPAQEFLRHAAISNAFQAQASALALARELRPTLRAHAETMAREHEARALEMDALAERIGLDVAAVTLDDNHQGLINQLRAAPDEEFESIYAAQQTLITMNELAAFEMYAASGEDTALQDFAAHWVPRLRDRLIAVRMLPRL